MPAALVEQLQRAPRALLQSAFIDQVGILGNGFKIGFQFRCEQAVIRLVAPGIEQGACVASLRRQLILDAGRRRGIGIALAAFEQQIDHGRHARLLRGLFVGRARAARRHRLHEGVEIRRPVLQGIDIEPEHAERPRHLLELADVGNVLCVGKSRDLRATLA